MKILQINSHVNSGSTGRMAEDIGSISLKKGHDSYIAYGRGKRPSQSQLIKIGNQRSVLFHGLKTVIFDRHAFGSKNATLKLIQQIDEISPDVIGLHNLHGYYLNIEVLFNYLANKNIPVLWTLFDCWSFTGHCAYFDDIGCPRWKTGCFDCPKKNRYPASFVIDNSIKNYSDKKQLFNKPINLEIVVHSKWLENLVQQSFLQSYPINLIHSGVDLKIFRPIESNIYESYRLNDKKIILGVASIWDWRKGLNEFKALAELISEDYHIVLIGLTKNQKKDLPSNVTAISRTENVEELAMWYSTAVVFLNPTFLDNFPTTNLESLACGTPVITYNTGGSPEAIDDRTGIVVEKGSIKGLQKAILEVAGWNKELTQDACRQRAENLFNKDNQFYKYLELYKKLSKKG